MQNRIHIAVPVLVAAALVVGACSSGPPVADAGEPGDLTAPGSSANNPDYVAAVRARFTDCAAIGATIAPYVTGLVSSPSERFDSSGVYCTWASTDSPGSRAVEIRVEPGNGVVAAASAPTTGLAMIPDARIESLGGLAYSMSVSTAGTAYAATKVELPQVSVSMTVGGRGAQPMLSGPAAVQAAKSLLGL